MNEQQTAEKTYDWKTCPQYFEVSIEEYLHQRHGIPYKDIKEHGNEMMQQVVAEGNYIFREQMDEMYKKKIESLKFIRNEIVNQKFYEIPLKILNKKGRVDL